MTYLLLDTIHFARSGISLSKVGYTTPHFFKINTPIITFTLHCSITMVGGHERQSEYNTTFTPSSASASASAVSTDWLIAPYLQNVRVDTHYVGINEEQKQQIRQLQEELAEFNCA
jgi:hypothetical protein